MTVEELQLVEVLVNEVSSPRNDGTAGSALYAVPFRLNRAPRGIEVQLLKHVWDSPPEWTSMHRPGILRVAGDRVVLDGTTVEEVERYHAKTLRIVFNEVNARALQQREREEAVARQRAEDEMAHRANVENVARRIDLGVGQ